MTFPVVPVCNTVQDVEEFSLCGTVVLPFKAIDNYNKHFIQNFPRVNVIIDLRQAEEADVTKVLNLGVAQVIVDDKEKASGFPASRVIVVGEDLVTDTSKAPDGNDRKYVEFGTDAKQEQLNEVAKKGFISLVPVTVLTTNPKDTLKVNVGEVFTLTLTTDRPDNLYTTLVTDPEGVCLGVVYSSIASIHELIALKSGVYQLRKRPNELWYKGATLGATQQLLSLSKDCDNDVVKFVVTPKSGYGFCHNSSDYSCFGDRQLAEADAAVGGGIRKLSNLLSQRKVSAPEGSYTARLFNDDALLVAKLKEELDELIDAGKQNDKAEIAWEAADLLYFILTWCTKYGVLLADIEKNLDIKSLKVTRRKGDAKPQYEAKKEEAKEEQKVSEDPYNIEVIDYNLADKATIERALTRPVQKTLDIMKLVLPIINNVKQNGDKALLELTAKFDGVTLDTPVLKAPFPEDMMQISDDMKKAIDISIANIEKFHAAQLPKEEMMTVETCPGVKCSRFAKPIENVGLYVPGGTAVLPLTAMMLGVPAKVAGCRNIIFASPPSRATGKLTPEVVYVAHKLGAKAIVMAGGAQAVTAMAYGTELVLKCDKILGPGNQFVTAAKMYVQNDTQALCSIDMPAGPSEVLVIADEDADADFVALDLLSQAEHGVDSQVILVGVSLSQKKIAEFQEAVSRQAAVLPRKDIVAKSLAHSFTLLTNSYEQAFEVLNRYAPEHLILQIENAQKFVPSKIENAGSVFVGALLPESCGDYSSGTNHTLPTYGYARQYSGVNTATFQKFITAQDVTEEGLNLIGKAVMTLAEVEGLEAHRNAVHVRMEKLGLL
ncbi:histidinol dehydrogenase [Kocuria palustris]|nr:histidinol dehydrogenase [Kocuria palustris]